TYRFQPNGSKLSRYNTHEVAYYLYTKRLLISFSNRAAVKQRINRSCRTKDAISNAYFKL
ncbi:AAEL013545-PA, partial [Aedes aegypti]